jgi:multisubunit Na+/H+ antiporter MnhB subunit
MALPAVAMIVLAVVYRHQPLPTPSIRPLDTTGTGGTKLSGACRALSLLVAVGIGVEFAVVYFGTELLTAASGLSVTAAARP